MVTVRPETNAQNSSQSVVYREIKALKDSNPEVRRDATEALRRIKDGSAVPDLIEALKDQDWMVRYRAARALGKIGDGRAVPVLIEALKGQDSGMRYHAAGALEVIGDVRAVPALIDALKDRDSGICFSMAWALETIGGSETLPLKVLATPHLTPADKLDTMVALREVWSEIGDMHLHSPLPSPADYCQSLLAHTDLEDEGRAGALEVLAEIARRSGANSSSWIRRLWGRSKRRTL